MTPPGKTRYIGREVPGSLGFVQLLASKFSLATAIDPAGFLAKVEKWSSLAAYQAWFAAYRRNQGSFLDHAVWGADRDLGGGKFLYGAMDDRYATNAARVFISGGLHTDKHVVSKNVCVIGSWDGTECLLLRAMGAKHVDAVDEVPAFGDMAEAQYKAWNIPGFVHRKSLYDLNVGALWQAYDLIYVPGVMYHLTDLPTALVMLWAMLAPGGTLAFESITDPKGSRSARYLGASMPGWNWWSPTPECYEAAMKDCGFPDGRTVECSHGRGWWVGTKSENVPAIGNGAAGFSRPDVLKMIHANRRA
jgi:hypothetical protein